MKNIIVEPKFGFEEYNLKDLVYKYLDSYVNFSHEVLHYNYNNDTIYFDLFYENNGVKIAETYNTLFTYPGVDIDLYIEKVKREYMIDKLLDI